MKKVILIVFLSISLPDQVAQQWIDDVADSKFYSQTVDDGNGNQIPNPQTKTQFVQEFIYNYIKLTARMKESNDAGNTANKNQSSSFDLTAFQAETASGLK